MVGIKKFAKSYNVLTRKLIKSSIYLSTEDFIIFTIFLTHPSTCPTEPRTISQSQWPETFGNHIILYSIYRSVRSEKIHILTYLPLQTSISNSNSIKKRVAIRTVVMKLLIQKFYEVLNPLLEGSTE